MQYSITSSIKQRKKSSLTENSNYLAINKFSTLYLFRYLFAFFLFSFATPQVIFSQSQSTHKVVVTDNYTNKGLDSAFVQLFSVANNSLLQSGFTENGSISFVFTPVSVSNSKSLIPSSFSLSNSYPLPSQTGVSKVDVALSKSGTISYGIYNIKGEEIFKDNSAMLAGNYSLNVKINDLANGIYFLRITNSAGVSKITKVLKMDVINYSNQFSNRFNLNYNNLPSKTFKTTDGEEYRIDVSRNKYDDASVLTNALDGQSTSLSLSRNNDLKISVYDQNNNLIDMLLDVSSDSSSFSIDNGSNISVKSGMFNVSNSSSGFSKDFEIPSVDTLINYDMLVREVFDFLIKYIDGAFVSNLDLKIGSDEVVSSSEGSVQLELFPGDYRVMSLDSLILLDTLVSVSSSPIELKVKERIDFAFMDLSGGEYDTLRFNLPVSFPSSGVSDLVSLDENLVIEKLGENEYTAYAKTFGDFKAKLSATAEHGTKKDTVYTINFEDMKRFAGNVFDNVKYSFGAREFLEAKIRIFYDGKSFESEGSSFDFQIPSNVNKLDSVKYNGVASDTSFVTTYRDFPLDSDLVRLDFLATTFDRLIYDHNVPADSGVSVKQYERIAGMGIFKLRFTEGLKGINVDNINNPIYENEDPTTDHGYEYVIPLGQMAELTSAVKPWTKEEQLQLKEIIENDINTKYPVGKRMRVRLLTENDTLPMFKNDNGVIIGAYPGVTIVNNRGSYYFRVQDFNKDGWIDACYVDLGADFNINLGGTRQELHSVYITMPIWPSQISGDVNNRSVFLQSGYKSHDFTQTVDNKMINGLLMNMSDNLMTSYDYNGKERIKVNYIPKTSQKDIIGN